MVYPYYFGCKSHLNNNQSLNVESRKTMKSSIVESYYKELRKDLTYPAKWALRYARQYVEIDDLESRYDVEIIIHPEEISPRDSFEFEEDVKHVLNGIESGNEWAWCLVEVKVSFGGAESSDFLGGCSYGNEEDFKRGGYYYDMLINAIEEVEGLVVSDQSGEH